MAMVDSDQKFRALTESTSDAIVSCDSLGQITMWNRGAESIFGYSPVEAYAISLSSLIPARLRSAHEAGMKRVALGGEQRVIGGTVELEALRKDGSEFPIELSLSKWESAGETYFTAIIRDVSERVWSHRLKLTRIEISRLILQTPSVAEVIGETLRILGQLMGCKIGTFWAFDKNDQVLRAQQTWPLAMASEDSMAQVNQTFLMRKGLGLPGIMWDQSAAWFQDIQNDPRLLRRDRFRKLDLQTAVAFPIGTGDDFLGLIEFFSSSVIKPQENVLVLLDDIGSYLNHFIRRKIAEENAAALLSQMEAKVEERTRKLQASEARHRFLADASSILASSTDYLTTLQHIADLCIPTIADWCVVDIFDEKGSAEKIAISHANKNKVTLARKLAKQFPPRPDALLGPAHVQKTGVSEIIPEISPQMLAATAVDKNHLQILTELSLKSYICVPLKIDQHTFGAMTLIYSESNRQYSAEDIPFMEEVARRAALAAERTRLLNQAQSANKAKDEFLATLSHELRTPMNVILGWVEILHQEPDKKTLATALEMLERNSKIQIKLINDLIDTSRITAGKLPVESLPLQLASTVEAVVTANQVTAKRNGLHLKVSIIDSDVVILGDDIRLSQVLQNLLNNSIKFTPRGGCIDVTLIKTSSEALIKVTDTGIGIAQEFLPFVFEAFRQEDGTTTRKYGGLGLGLGISKYLVQRQGGRLEVQSLGRDQGTSFTITLPLTQAKKAAPDLGNKAMLNLSKQNSARPLDGVKILAVDDSTDILYLLNRRLQKWGADVEIAGSAKDALSEIKKKLFDLILCDIGMPEQDGLSFIRALRSKKFGAKSQIPAIALTAYARDEEVKAALDAGFEMHVAKPVSEAMLLNRILTVLHPSN